MWSSFAGFNMRGDDLLTINAIIAAFIGLVKWKVKACANRCCSLHGQLTPNGMPQQIYQSTMEYNEHVEIKGTRKSWQNW